MPDDNTISPAAIGAQLALALYGIFQPDKANQVVTAGNLLVAAMTNYRASKGLPADWVPSAEDWNALIAENATEIAQREARIAELQAQLPAQPNDGGATP